MVPLEVADWAREAVGGSMLLAVPVAALAGLVSFFSPCVLPLLPGYLSYATGLAAADITAGRRRGRVLTGTLLFVAGFALVFVSSGVLVGSLGSVLRVWQRPITIGVGVLTIALGLLFAGWLPWGRGAVRLNAVPRIGLAAAPLLGIVFGLGWTPCIGPALSVVLNLALNEATALRGGLLALVYALGLGVPFVLAGVIAMLYPLAWLSLLALLAALSATLIVWTYRAPRELLVALGLTSLTSLAYSGVVLWAFVA